MNCRIVDMRHKEVINAKDGMRLGFVDDVEVDTCTAKLVAIIIYGRLKLLGLFGRCDDIVICWDEIELKRLLRVCALVSSNWRADTSPGAAAEVCSELKKLLSAAETPVFLSDSSLSTVPI